VEAVTDRDRRKQLEERLAADSAYEDKGLIFATALGKPIQGTSLQNGWKRIAQKAGLRQLRLHDPRRAHASLLLRQGAHPKIVSERLGHAEVGRTLNTHSHVLPQSRAEAADRLADF